MRVSLTLALVLASGMCRAQSMAGYQYWFDQEAVASVFVPITTGTLLDIVAQPPVDGLPQGAHRVYFRLRDTQGRWSSVHSRSFTVHPEGPHQLVVLRYWSDQAPNAPSDMVELEAETPAQLLDIVADIDLCTQAQAGPSRLFFQLKDHHGQWSSVLTRDITIDVVGSGPGTATIECPACSNGIEPLTEYTFFASAPGATEYEWAPLPAGWVIVSQNGDQLVATSPASPGDGTMTVTPSNNCGNGTDGSYLLSPAGLLEATPRSGMVTYPNPSNGLFRVSVNEQGPWVVSLFTSTGQLAWRSHSVNAQGQLTVDASDLANGTYIVLCASPEVLVRSLITIQR